MVAQQNRIIGNTIDTFMRRQARIQNTAFLLQNITPRTCKNIPERSLKKCFISCLTNCNICNGASKCHGAAAAKAEARKTKDYKSKVDGIQTQLIPAALELNGRWGDGLVLLSLKEDSRISYKGRPK